MTWELMGHELARFHGAGVRYGAHDHCLTGPNQGVIEQPAYVALVLMALLTIIATPLVLRDLLLK